MKIEPFYVSLGTKLQKIRSGKNLSQAFVGDKLNPRMTRASVANFEAGKQRILAHTLVQLSNVLDFDLNDLKDSERIEEVPLDRTKEIEQSLKNELSPKTARELIKLLTKPKRRRK